MNNYFISKDNKSGEIVYLEYDKEGYKVTPKRKKEDATHIETKLKQHFGADTHVGIHLEPIKVNGKYQKPE